MSWQLSFSIVYNPAGQNYIGFPGSSDEPCYIFRGLDELVEFLREMGVVAGLGGLDEYADRVRREGEVMQHALEDRRRKDHAAVDRAVARVRRQGRPAAGTPARADG